MAEQETTSLAGADIEVRTLGDGEPLLFLHGEDGLLFCGAFLDALATGFSVTAPSHPGWGASPRTPRFRTLDDVAYVYLDLLESLPGPVHLVGCSLGAWLAMELATKCSHDLASLTLVAPVGIRTGAPTERHYLDLYATPPQDVTAALYGDPARAPSLAGFTDEEFAALAAAQEATTYFAWEPYMHNPCLLDRLHRVRIPTLVVTGEEDGFVLAPGHVASITSGLGGEAGAVTLAGVGHRVEEEAPVELADAVTAFCRQATGTEGPR